MLTAQSHHQVVAQLTGTGAPFEVHRIEQGGHSVLAYKNAQGSIRDQLDHGRQFADKVFIEYQQRQLTFAEFFRQVDQLASTMQRRFNIAKGDRVAIAMRNSPEWVAAFTAIIQIGAVAVPLNSWGRAEELHQGLEDSRAKLVFCDHQRFQYIDPAHWGIAAIVDQPSGGDDVHVPSIAWSEALGETDWQPVDIEPQDPAIILFTSGTSGRPKGALFTHFTCVQALFNIEFIGAATYMTHTDVMNQQMASGVPAKLLLAVPLFHISGLFSQCLMNMKHGRSIHMMYKWDVNEAVRLIKEAQITILMGAPTMMQDVLQHPDLRDEDLQHITNISAGGAATPVSLTGLYRERLPKTLAGAGWGLTETAGTGAAFTGDLIKLYPTSSGVPSPIIELRFCDEVGMEVPAGERGELWVRSAACFSGYDSGGSGAEDFIDGFFKTGDVGYINEDGILYLCDRVKDMVIRGGENIYPVEVEHCLNSHPDCLEAAVFGLPDERYGESVAAVVRLRAGVEHDVATLQAYAREHLAEFKVPTRIAFASEEMPRNATQKLLKRQIRERHFPEP